MSIEARGGAAFLPAVREKFSLPPNGECVVPRSPLCRSFPASLHNLFSPSRPLRVVCACVSSSKYFNTNITITATDSGAVSYASESWSVCMSRSLPTLSSSSLRLFPLFPDVAERRRRQLEG
jgi:hypothetical protein